VELDFHPDMLRYYERPLEVLGSTQEGIPAHASLHLPPTKGLRDWRTQMSKRDRETFEAIAGDVLERLGYKRSVPVVPTRIRLRADTCARVRFDQDIREGADPRSCTPST
jgi:hypothetical protein